MRTWSELFGVDDDAILGSPDSYRASAKELEGAATEIELIVGRLAVSWDQTSGFNGLAADAFVALTGSLADMMRPVPDPMRAVSDGLNSHGDELDELILDAATALRTANDRYDRVERAARATREVRRELETATDDAPLVAAAVLVEERSERDARADLERSRTTYDRLRDEEDDLNARTEAVLASNPIPFQAVAPWNTPGAGATAFPILAGSPTTAWLVLREVFLTAGIDLSYPSQTSGGEDEEHGEGCIWTEDGELHIHVGGPRGGDFVVGADISQGVYAALLVLLDGHIPDHRSWQSVHDLSEEEYSALNWAFNSNFGVGYGAQTQMTGINGTWQNYIEGGEWTPQPIHTMDGFALATDLVYPDNELADVVLEEIEPLRTVELCPEPADGGDHRGSSD